MGVLSPETVLETVHLVAPTGIIAVQGYAENVPKTMVQQKRPIIDIWRSGTGNTALSF
jgi:hypothetical protein